MDANPVNGLTTKPSSLTLGPSDAGSKKALSRSHSSGRVHEVPTGDNPIVRVLHALRLHWPLILLLGLPLSSALAYVAWYNTPTPYTAYAELFCQPRKFFWETKDSGTSFEVYKQTTMRLIKDPLVLTAAVRDPSVAKLDYVRESTDDVLERLMKELRVSSPAQEFIRLELSGNDPQELASMVNAVTEAFIDEVFQKGQESRKERLGKLESVLNKDLEDLRTKQEALRKHDKEMGIGTATQVDLVRQSKLDMQLQIRREMSELYPQIIELDLLLGKTDGQSAEVPAEPAENANPVESLNPSDELNSWLMKDREFARLVRERSGAKRLLDEWRRRVQEPHREISRLATIVEESEQKLVQRQAEIEPVIQNILLRSRTGSSASGTREQMEGRHKMLTALLKRYQTELEEIQKSERKQAVDWVEREKNAEEIADLKKTTDIYSDEVQKRRVELDNAPPAIRVHQKARTPTVADQKKRYMYTFAGASGGFGLVAALIVLLEIAAQRVCNISQVRSKTVLPVLGALPLIPLNLSRLRSKKQRHAAVYWRDALREAFDGVQSMLRHSPRCDEARLIMVASSAEAEGKTTSVSQLASSFARAGYRVLLVDGDLRRPTLPREFGLTNQHGLCEVLEGQMTWESAVVPTELPELDLLPAGHLTDKTRGLLSKEVTGQLFQEFLQQYNYVFVDSAPVLLSADTLSLAKHVDGVLMLVRKDLTRLRRLESALSRFEMIGVPVFGLLSIGLGDSSTSYGYGYGYGAVQPRQSDAASPSARLADSRTAASV